MPEAAVAPAPTAASTSAPAPSAPAPVAAPTTAPSAPATTTAAPKVPAQPTFGKGSGVTSHVDPTKFQGRGAFDRNAYTAAVLEEQLAATAVEEPPAAVTEEVAPQPVDVPPDAVPEVLDEKPAVAEPVVEEQDFQLEPDPIVTPELLTQMVTDNPEFGKLLEADSRLKGQLYKTAREAAELQPYREIFPDLDSAKEAAKETATWVDMRETFMGSTTKEGAITALGKIAELSYERDADGNVLMQDGKPVIGEDFFGFVDNVVAMDLEHRAADVEARLAATGENAADVAARLNANEYHLDPRLKNQDQVNAAYARDLNILKDFQRLQYLKEEIGDLAATEETQQLPDNLRRKAEELDQREKALNTRQHGEKVEERRSFESGLQTEAQTRIHDGISKIIANVEKQGGVVSPYLKNILPKAIGAALIKKIQANPALQSQMHALQRLPIGDASRHRRLAAIDRAVQQYLPDVARAELREAGVQLASGAAAKRAQLNAQIDHTKKTEIRGTTAPAGTTKTPMTAEKAYDTAKTEWLQANPGRRFDKSAEARILGRVVQLQLQ